MIGKKAVVVAGATGSIGRLVVQTLLEDPRVNKVTALVRKVVSSEERVQELWGNKTATATAASVDPTVSKDGTTTTNKYNNKLIQVQVDYPKLTVHDIQLRNSIQGHDAFITALGVYSGAATEQEMDEIEGTYNSILARIAKLGGATRGVYLSGAGVKQPTLEGIANTKFARAKGRAEELLASIFSNNNSNNVTEEDETIRRNINYHHHISVRPAIIFDRPGPPVYGFLDGTLLNMYPFRKLVDTSYGITAHDIAKGIVQGALFDDDDDDQDLTNDSSSSDNDDNNNVHGNGEQTIHINGNTIWENVTLKEAARRYEFGLNEHARTSGGGRQAAV